MDDDVARGPEVRDTNASGQTVYRPDEPTSAEQQTGPTCRSCGASNRVHSRFCSACGAPLVEDPERSRLHADPLIGLLVGQRYRILARIGSGGMGAVYRVRHEQLGKEAAMKLLHGDLARDPAMVKRFVREAKAVSRLSSPHTVSVFDFGQAGGLVYLVMELLDGRDLGRVLADDGPLSPTRTARVVRQVAESLEEAHGLGIVHRDLKPQNIFLSPRDSGPERVKVLDFGLAKLVEAREDSMNLTQAGTVMGTPYYMSPEQIEDSDVDQRSDIYSLGAVVFRLLTGNPPFTHPNPLGILHRHLTDPVPSLATYDATLAPLDAVIARAMAKDASERYETVRALADGLERAVAAMSGASHTPQPGLGGRLAFETTDRVATREQFERFERRWRARRLLRSAIPVVVIPIALGSAVAATASAERWIPAREREPNDQVEQASRVVDGRTLSAEITPPSRDGNEDEDLFELPVVRSDREQRRRVRIEPEPAVALRVDAYDDSRARIASIDGEQGAAIELDGLPVDESIVLRVSGPSSPGAYLLTSTVRPAYEQEEREPNGERSVAPTLGDGETVVGVFGWPGDRDVFRLPGNAEGGTWVFELSGVARTDVAMEVFDEQGTVVVRLDAAGVGRGEGGAFEVDASEVVGQPLIAVFPTGDAAPGLTYEFHVRRRAGAGDSD